MVSVGLLARIEAKPERVQDVADLLTGARQLAEQEAGTVTWYAWQMGPTSFGIFDTFDDEDGRKAHLDGPIAAALVANADELLAKPPQIDPIDILAAK